MKRVVVLGAGYASLAFLKKLNYLEDYEIILINKNDYHYTSILLHEVVSGSRCDARFYLSEILPRNVRFIKDCVVSIEEKEVKCKRQNYFYDYLIVGLGFQSDTFGISGIKEFAIPIIDFESALNLKEKIYSQIQKFKTNKDLKDLKFAICGGGFSGIETIASLAINFKKECIKQGIDPDLLEFICIEAMSDILPMFPKKLVQNAKDYLQSIGVKLAVGSKILRCELDKVIIENSGQEEVIEAGVIIWTAGVKGNAVIEDSKFFTSVRSKVEVDHYLQPLHQENQDKMKNIYIIGDCAALKDPSNGRFYPPTAQIAIKQGEYLAQAFQDRILGRNVLAFTYHSEGTICSLGEKYAIGVVKEKTFSGRIAMSIKRFIEKRWLCKILGFKGIKR